MHEYEDLRKVELKVSNNEVLIDTLNKKIAELEQKVIDLDAKKQDLFPLHHGKRNRPVMEIICKLEQKIDNQDISINNNRILINKNINDIEEHDNELIAEFIDELHMIRGMLYALGFESPSLEQVRDDIKEDIKGWEARKTEGSR